MSDCTHVVAVLEGEAPWLEVDAHLAGCPGCAAHAAELAEVDSLAAELGELELPGELLEETRIAMEVELALVDLPLLEPPAELLAATRAAMARELAGAGEHPEAAAGSPAAASVEAPAGRVVRGPWGRRVGLAGGLLAAALALFAILPGETPVDPDRFVQKGVGERLPDVALKVAVSRDGQVERHSTGTRYAPGDTLYFRAQVDQPAWVGLLRVDPSGAQLVHAEELPAGEADLRLGSGPLAWRIEEGEGSAVFALVATAGEPGPEALVSALGSVNADPGAVCAAVEALGARCAAVPVGVQP